VELDLLLDVEVANLPYKDLVCIHGLQPSLHGGQLGTAIPHCEPGKGGYIGDEHRGEHERIVTHDSSWCFKEERER
jgi:hypothetical protein